ncbi:DTX3L-like protein, partial [Mya arenaria]
KENAGNVDEANQAKHNTPGSQTGFQYRNNTHTAEDSENRPSANIVSSDRAFKKQTVEIKHDFSQGEPNNSKVSDKSETTDNENNCQGPPLPVHGSTMDFHDSRTVHLAFYEVLKQKIHHAEITGDEEKETCDCTVIGHVQKVEDAMKQIHSIETTLAKNVISFDDIKNCKVDAESLNLHAYFEYQNTAGTDTYFYLNSARRKLYIVSENQQKADKATNSVKNVIVKQVLTNTEESHTEEETRFEDNVCVISMPGGTTNFIGAKADVERCISKRTTRTKTIEIQSDESFRLLCNFGVQNMIDSDKVSIVEITSNNKHGFVLKSTSEDNLKTGEIIIRAFEKSICLQVVCMSQDQFQKEDWTDISKQLCDKHSVVANIENVEKVCNGEGNHLAEKLCTFLNWKLSDYVTLKLSNRDPKEAWESILLYPVPEEYFAGSCDSEFNFIRFAIESWKLEQFVYNCLKTAEYLGFKSIAFPAFGTGKQLKYPKNDVAMAMTKAISDFCVRFAVCCLEEIRLVLNESDDDLIHEFETSLSKRVNILDGKKHTEISVIGKSEDVRCALQSMQEIVQAKFSARSMTHDEPVVPTIERDGDDGENEKQQGRLEDEPSVQLYVVIKGIKMNTAKQDLEKLLKTKRSPKTLIYQMGQTEAVVKCASAEDARQLLLQQKDNSNLRFEKVPPQPLVKKKITLNCESFKAIKDCLEKVPIDYNEMNKEYVISTPTEYEFKIVYSLLKDYKKRIRAESNTVHVEKIEAVSEQMYDILKNKLFTEIEGKWSHSFTPENESLLLEFENSMTATEHSKKFNSFFEKHKDDTFMDVECDKSQIGTEQWCKEIEQSNNGDDCCVFVPDKDKVIVFSSSFDECMNIKNALFVKQGKRQVKQTGRARRHVSPDQKPAKTEDPHLHQTSANQNDAKSMSFMTNEGISVKIYTASICNLDVDCIVNAANENLDHGGGVAAAILKAAGKAINSEGKSYIRTHGPIPVGQVCWTSAGNLKNDLIIHAVGPRWYNYDTSFWHGVEKCANDLKAALLNSFDAADRHKYATIALPAISSAIFGVPEDLCVMQYGKAVIGYSAKSRGTGLKEIHFVDINEGMTTRIRNMFYRMLTQNEKHPYTYESFVIASGRGRRRNEKSDSQYKKDESMFFPHSQGDTKSSSFSASLGKKPILQTIHISNTVTLEVQKVNDIGDISNVEALIVPVNPSGLNEIADEVERSIPQEYQISFLEKKTSGIRTHSRSGESFVLHGYSSGFKYLIFVVMPEGCMDGISLQQMFSEIFELCKGRSIRSLATFLLGFDKDENTIANMDVTAEDGVTMMVQALMDSLKEFSKEGQALQTVLLCKTPKMYEAISLSMALGQDDKKSGKGTEVKSEDSGPSTYVDETNDCVICMDTISLPKTLICGHVFCTECIDQCFKIGKVVCPTCFRVVGKITGDQPSGTMTSNHPSPGQPYRGIRRTAYFPNNDEGRTVCRMLKVAFRRKLVFTIGRSRTTGHDGVITWNDIHHKTDPLPGKHISGSRYFKR